jgi:glycosyltransferase involved in cell wall biosynthesis
MDWFEAVNQETKSNLKHINQALVSVIIPAYNDERYLAEAIGSVRKQAYAPYEIIIVNDGSTDGTVALARSLGPDVRIVNQDNLGPAAARNRGIGLAKGDLIAFLDADDVWPDDKLSLQVPPLLAEPGIEISMGMVQRLWLVENDDADRRFELRTPPSGVLLLGSAVCRRDTFDRIGIFDETLRIGEDTEWFFRARKVGVEIRILEQVTLYYRRHPDSLTAGVDHTPHFLSVLHKTLMRQRQDANPHGQ